MAFGTIHLVNTHNAKLLPKQIPHPLCISGVGQRLPPERNPIVSLAHDGKVCTTPWTVNNPPTKTLPSYTAR